MDLWPIWLILAAAVGFYVYRRSKGKHSISHLPERFVVFDLETTGLSPERHEIIEIGAFRISRDSSVHDTYQSLVKPTKKLPKRITQITGITQEMIDAKGNDLAPILEEFREFIGDLRIVSFNADFDMGFLNAATSKSGLAPIRNPVSCALKMARRAWPDRKGYRLADLARDGNLGTKDSHRALGDAQRAVIVYGAAAAVLRSVS